MKATQSSPTLCNPMDYAAAIAAAKLLQSCPTLCDPIDGSPPDSTIPGILQARTLEWLSFPSPPMDYRVHGILQARILEWVAFLFCRESSNPGTEPRSSVLQVDALTAETQGKTKNTGVGCLSHLQQIFLTQESNQGLLHCRQIL